MTRREASGDALGDRTERIRQAIQTMNPRHRAIFEWVRFKSMDFDQIADELGITADEVERDFALALAHIDRVFERDP